MNVRATPLQRKRSKNVAKMERSIAKLAAMNPEAICPWCGERHTKWVGDHIIPLAGARSPIVAAGTKCNISRIAVLFRNDQIRRLFSGKCAMSHPVADVKKFCEKWTTARYGHKRYLDIAIADSGPAMRLKRRVLYNTVFDEPAQRKADKAYIELDNLSENDILAMRRRPLPTKRKR